MNSRPWVAEQIGSFSTFTAPLLAFTAILVALLAIPNPVVMLSSGGSYSPLVSLFVAGIKSEALPSGWTLISANPGAPLEIYATASIMLALMVSFPIISYQAMKSIAPVLATRRRTLYSLVACAWALLFAGALFGNFFLVHYYMPSLLPFFDAAGMSPYLDSAGFYFFVFRTIGVSAVAFTLPVYIYALVRFRLLERSSQRLPPC